MRPVRKLDVGEQIPDESGGTITILEKYNPYWKAKQSLILNIGTYCSYCEQKIKSVNDIQIEHVQPKALYPNLKYNWANFLIACACCNGVYKEGKDVVLNNIHLPHTHNTFLSIVYSEGGLITINTDLPEAERVKAQNLIDLVGLDKKPGQPEYNSTDKRWFKRVEAWRLANTYKAYYEDGMIDSASIIELVKTRGYWSVWFTIFESHAEIKRALINCFPGTAKNCFDTNLNPIERI